nr:hypothetical protein [Salmonella enterica]
MRRLCGGMSASGAAAVRRYVRIRRCGCGLTWNPPQRGIVRRIRSPAKAANVLSMLLRLNTRTACCASLLSLLCAFNFCC